MQTQPVAAEPWLAVVASCFRRGRYRKARFWQIRLDLEESRQARRPEDRYYFRSQLLWPCSRQTCLWPHQRGTGGTDPPDSKGRQVSRTVRYPDQSGFLRADV